MSKKNPDEPGEPIDATRFRSVMSNHPTGVVAVSAVEDDGTPVGMIVGTFMSASLDPPLVSFLTDRNSSTWPRIEGAQDFCVSMLADSQRHVVASLATKGSDKFATLDWTPGSNGAPAIDSSLGWIEARIESVVSAGDHTLVLGAVTAMRVGQSDSPMLFFRNNLGRYAMSQSPADADTMWRGLGLAEVIRPVMEAVARDLNTTCTAMVLADDELVTVSSVGSGDPATTPVPVGTRYPFAPPMGSVFAAWGGDLALNHWMTRIWPGPTDTERVEIHRTIEMVRERGYAIGLGFESRTSLAIAEGDMDEDPRRQQFAELRSSFNPAQISTASNYDLRHVSVPVLGPGGSVVLQLVVWGPRQKCSGAIVNEFASRALAAAQTAAANVADIGAESRR